MCNSDALAAFGRANSAERRARTSNFANLPGSVTAPPILNGC